MDALVSRNAKKIVADSGVLEMIKTQEQQHRIIKQQNAKR